MAPNLKGTGSEVMDPINRNGVKEYKKYSEAVFRPFMSSLSKTDN